MKANSDSSKLLKLRHSSQHDQWQDQEVDVRAATLGQAEEELVLGLHLDVELGLDDDQIRDELFRLVKAYLLAEHKLNAAAADG